MSATIHTTTYRLLKEHLRHVIDVLIAGYHDLPPDITHRLIRSVGAARSLLDQHQIDDNGCCQICRVGQRRWWPPRRRPARLCTVYAAYSFYLNQPDQLVMTELTGPRKDAGEVEQTVQLPAQPIVGECNLTILRRVLRGLRSLDAPRPSRWERQPSAVLLACGYRFDAVGLRLPLSV